VTDITEGGHGITGVFVPNESITLVRPAYDVKRFHLDDDNVSTYIAESIINARGDTDNREYLIHWRGFPNEFDTWEPDKNVKDRSMVVQADRRWPPPPRATKAPVQPREINPLCPEEIVTKYAAHGLLKNIKYLTQHGSNAQRGCLRWCDGGW
jgi:hypothetical protein